MPGRCNTVVALLALLSPGTVLAQDIPPEKAEEIIREIQESHISANVPPDADFHRILRCDLSAYFSTEAVPNPSVEYELLRDGPTQSGIAYPKFYVWIRVQTSPVRQGVARLAAIDRERFEVTHFIEQGAIVGDPSQLDALFPAPVAAAIKAKANQGAP